MTTLPQTTGMYDMLLQPGDRRYAISIPNNYQPERTVPLILVLHWGGPNQPFRGEAILSSMAYPALKELEAIMIAPDCNTNSWSNPQSEQDLLDLLNFIEAEYSIDQNKRLITGFSMGGLGAWYFVARHQERFTAALPVAANPPAEVLDINWQLPIYAIHSTADEIFAIGKTKAVVQQLKEKGVAIDLKIITGVGHFNTDGFNSSIQAAIPWIKQIWKII